MPVVNAQGAVSLHSAGHFRDHVGINEVHEGENGWGCVPESANFLVLGASGSAGVSIIKRIRELWPKASVAACDSIDVCAGYSLADRTLRLRASNDEGRLTEIKDFIVDAAINLIIPANKSGAWIVSRGLSAIRSVGAEFLGASVDAIFRCDHKSNYYSLNLLRSSVPKLIGLENGLPSKFPCFVKPEYGAGSERVLALLDVADAKYCEFSDKFIVQELINGWEYSVDCLLLHTGDFVAVPRRRLQKLGGVTTLSHVTRSPSIVSAAKEVYNQLALSGVACIQFIEDNGGGLHLIDVNARFGSSFSICECAGVDFVALLVNSHFRREIRLPTLREVTVERLLSNFEIRAFDLPDFR